ASFLICASYAACVRTCANPRIVEWPRPHSSAHTIGYVPSRFGVTRYLTSIPGTASFLTRNDGTQKSCSTSRDWSVNSTCLLIGTYSCGADTSLPLTR